MKIKSFLIYLDLSKYRRSLRREVVGIDQRPLSKWRFVPPPEFFNLLNFSLFSLMSLLPDKSQKQLYSEATLSNSHWACGFEETLYPANQELSVKPFFDLRTIEVLHENRWIYKQKQR